MKTGLYFSIDNNLIRLFFILSSLYFLHLVEAQREALNVNSSSSKDDHKAKGSKIISPSMALILILLAIVFVIIGWIFIYCKQIPGTSFYDTPSAELGLDHSVINRFPTLLYSDVKKLKVGKGQLECAVCLDEFRDESETLRLLPKCYHLYHRECIDVWLVDHTTCPVCRANLVPNPAELTQEEPHLQESELMSSSCEQVEIRVVRSEVKTRFQRSYTTGYSVVQVGEDCERFTLRLPDGVRRQLLVAQPTLQRAVSLSAWPRFPSSPQGYRNEGGGTK